jgi:prolipoprotein diacylglyceryltransferase
VTLRWQALALAVVIVLSLGVWVRRLRRRFGPSLRFEDVAFVLLGAIPGAVVGGRLFHGIAFADVYATEPMALLDLGQGSLSLVGAVLGGALTAGYVCRLLGHRVGPWADAAALPLLLAVGLGKLVMVLGGAGQGAPFDSPIALSFGGDGPWASLDAGTPAHASQVYEGVWALIGIALVGWLERSTDRGRAGQGILLVAAVGWWLAGRALSALTWRDDPILGPIGAEGLVTIVVLSMSVGLLALLLEREGSVRITR